MCLILIFDLSDVLLSNFDLWSFSLHCCFSVFLFGTFSLHLSLNNESERDDHNQTDIPLRQEVFGCRNVEVGGCDDDLHGLNGQLTVSLLSTLNWISIKEEAGRSIFSLICFFIPFQMNLIFYLWMLIHFHRRKDSGKNYYHKRKIIQEEVDNHHL